MAARIGWANKKDDAWVVSSWTFRQLLEDVLSLYPDDPELTSELNAASRVKHLFLDNFHPDMTEKVTDAIRETAAGICSGRLQSRLAAKPYGTPDMVAEYRLALEKLVAMVGSLPDFAP